MKPTPTQIDLALSKTPFIPNDGNRAWMAEALSAALSVPAEAVVGEPVAWRYKLENWGPEYWQYFTKEPRHKEPGEVWQPLYAAPSAPEGWQPEAGLQWHLDRIGEEISADRKQNALAYLSFAFAEISSRLEWLPIETAPKDGTNILVWSDSFEWPEIVRYEHYPSELAASIGEPGYWRYSEELLADVANVEDEAVTHWRPIPAPPAIGGKP